MSTCNNYKGHNKQHSRRIQMLTLPLFSKDHEGKKEGKKEYKGSEERKKAEQRIKLCVSWGNGGQDAETTFLDPNDDCIKG